MRDRAVWPHSAGVILVMLRSLSYGQTLQTARATIASSARISTSSTRKLSRYEGVGTAARWQPVDELKTLELRDVTFEYSTVSPS